MKTLAAVLALFLFIGSGFAQQSSTPPDLALGQLNFSLQNPPQKVTFGSAANSGNPGPASYYYWVVSNYTIGNSTPAGPFIITNAPNTLASGSGVTLSWRAASGAASYDVLRTSTSAMPVGACNCAVATGVTGTSTIDQSSSLNAYTVTTYSPNLATITVTNINGTLQFGGPVNFTAQQSFSNFTAPGPSPWVDPTDPAYRCKGDGLTDDTACMQAAITAAAVLNAPLFLPPNKKFLISCTGGGTDCLSATHPLMIFGSKGGQGGLTSTLLIPNTISNTKHLLHLTAGDTNTDGWDLRDFQILCQSGTCDPLSLIVFDSTNNPIARPSMRGVLELGVYGADTCGLRVINPSATNGLFDGKFEFNAIANGSTGLCMQRIGDDNRFEDNNFVGSGIGANFTCVPGALGHEFRHNVFTNNTAAFHVGDGCTGVRIHENQMEGNVGVTGSNGAYVDVDCTAANPCVDVQIYNNQKIAPVASGINGIRLNWTRAAQISNNALFVSGGGAGAVITTANNDPASSILWPNDHEPNTLTQSVLVQDSLSILTKLWGFPQSSPSNGGAGGGLQFNRSIATPQVFTGTIINTAGTNGFTVPAIGQTDANLVGTDVSQFLANKLNRVSVAADFTVAGNTSLQAITGLSWALNANNGINYSFHCALAYSQATAAVSDAFGIQASASPTNIFATGQVYTAAATTTTNTLPTLNTTTATNIVTFTPSATAANFVAYLDGTIENPAQANTVNIMVSTSNAGDLITIKRGSSCWMF